MLKRSKPFVATPEQVLVLDDISLQLAARTQHPEKYGLDADQLLENNEALEHLKQRVRLVGTRVAANRNT